MSERIQVPEADMNITVHPESATQPFFRAVLRPHRSLSQPGFLIVMGAIGFVSFVCGVAFLTIGAWPVFGFFGLDLVLIYWAFRVNYAQAQAAEIIEIIDHEMRVTRISQYGERASAAFNPRWVRFELIEDKGETCRLLLGERSNRVEIGSFLGDAERRAFAQDLRRALGSYRSLA